MQARMRHELLRLEGEGWSVQLRGEPTRLPEVVVGRYSWIPGPVRDFLGEVDLVCRVDEKLWLLTVADYLGESGSAFSWNEREIESLASTDDEITKAEIRSFWNEHLPIALSVEDEYGYYALRSDSTVVFGSTPETEIPSAFSNSYLDFLIRLK